jgi:cytochrome b561
MAHASVVEAYEPYGSVARLLHWTIAVLVVVTVPVGIIMIRLPGGSAQNVLFILHKGIGVILLVLLVVRLLWRLTHRPPALTGIPRWQILVSGLVHGLLYALLLIMAVTGYVGTVAGDFPIELLDRLGIPPLLSGSKPTSEAAFWVHTTIIWPLLALIALHIAAALHHGFVRRDHVLQRMWPGVRRRVAPVREGP